MAFKRTAYLLEAGNGFPDVSDYVQHDGGAYRVVSIPTGTILTRGAGEANCIAAELVPVDWSDFSGDPFPCGVRWDDGRIGGGR